MVGRGSDLYQLCKDIDDTIKGVVNASVVKSAQQNLLTGLSLVCP